MSQVNLEVLRGLAQAAADCYDGALDDNGERVDLGLKRDEGHPVFDSRTMDGFKIKLSGNHCIINTSSSIDHDNFISNFVSIAPGVNTSGGVKIGEASHIGINSSIKQKVSIGKNVIIGAMTFVNQNCKNNLMIYGTPMRIIKKRKISDNYL